MVKGKVRVMRMVLTRVDGEGVGTGDEDGSYPG